MHINFVQVNDTVYILVKVTPFQISKWVNSVGNKLYNDARHVNRKKMWHVRFSRFLSKSSCFTVSF